MGPGLADEAEVKSAEGAAGAGSGPGPSFWERSLSLERKYQKEMSSFLPFAIWSGCEFHSTKSLWLQVYRIE